MKHLPTISFGQLHRQSRAHAQEPYSVSAEREQHSCTGNIPLAIGAETQTRGPGWLAGGRGSAGPGTCCTPARGRRGPGGRQPAPRRCPPPRQGCTCWGGRWAGAGGRHTAASLPQSRGACTGGILQPALHLPSLSSKLFGIILVFSIIPGYIQTFASLCAESAQSRGLYINQNTLSPSPSIWKYFSFPQHTNVYHSRSRFAVISAPFSYILPISFNLILLFIFPL